MLKRKLFTPLKFYDVKFYNLINLMFFKSLFKPNKCMKDRILAYSILNR